MKESVYLSFVILLGIITSACSSGARSLPDEPIKPGVKIGELLITTGGEAEAAEQHELDCIQQGEGDNYRCEAKVGSGVNVSMGVYDSQYSGKLEELWADHTYEMSINNHTVDLQAFGSVDYAHPMVGPMRHWNVVVVADKPGDITVHSDGIVGGDPFDNTTTFVFSKP